MDTLHLISVFLLIGILANAQIDDANARSCHQHDIMMGRPQSNTRHEFLKKCLNSTSILEYELKSLTKPGDNYNSKLQAIEVKSAKNSESNIETLHMVMKTMTTGSISTRKSQQFSNEMHFYKYFIPTIQKFEQDKHIPLSERLDAFVRYFGSRLSLNPDAQHADSNAITLLENAKSQNFSNIDQIYGFEKNETLAILKRLAKMHALFIAIRRKEPSVFAEKLYPYLHTVYNDSFIETLIKTADEFADMLPISFPNMTTLLYTSIRNQLNYCKEFVRNTNRAPDTPYTTIYHRDLWTKNIMINRNESEKSIQVRILDFQAYDYESFAFDLTFFLLINANVDDLRTNFNGFIRYYHSEFVNTMCFVECPLDDYTYEKMWNEIKGKAKLNLLNLYLYLAQDQKNFIQNNRVSANGVGNLYHVVQSTPETILNRWKCINDIYVENEFI